MPEWLRILTAICLLAFGMACVYTVTMAFILTPDGPVRWEEGFAALLDLFR